MRRSHGFKLSVRAGRYFGVSALIAGTMTASLLGIAGPAAHAATSASAPKQVRLPILDQLPARVRMAASSHATGPSPAAVTAAARNGWSQVNEMSGPSASSSCSYDECLFGYSVATYGDTMVVGAPNDNGGIGEVYVYTGSGSSWVQEGELTPPDATGPMNFFGGSVAISSGSIVVGAWFQSNYEGAAYVYTYSGSGATFTDAQQQEITDPGQASDDFFGTELGISGSSIAIGASGENSNEGAVFIYTLVDGSWSLDATLADPGGIADDAFGSSLALHSSTLVVGSWGAEGTLSSNMGEAFTGAAYVYQKVRGSWVEQAKLVASNGEGCVQTCTYGYDFIGGDYFGSAVALNGKTVVVSAPYASAPTSATGPQPDGGYSQYAPDSTGTAYVFTESGGTWTQKDELYDPAEATGGGQDLFGYSVAFLGHSVVVNAPYDPEGNSTGASFVFSSNQATWATYPTELNALDGVPGDYFGYGLATIGHSYVLVGSPYSPDKLYFFER